MQKRQSPGLVSDGTNTDGVKETDVNTQFRSRDPVKMALSVGSHPTLMAYLRRVGATERNFRKHVIVVADEYAYMGGKREIATIKIEEDGTVDCNIKDYEPTADEQKAIKAEVGAAPFPKSINARKTMVPPQLMGVDPKDYFLFWINTSQTTSRSFNGARTIPSGIYLSPSGMTAMARDGAGRTAAALGSRTA